MVNVTKFLIVALQATLIAMFMSSAGFAQSNNTELVNTWIATATRAEDVLETNLASTPAMEALRAELVEQRSEALGLEVVTQSNIVPLRTELDVLGPPPDDGIAEASEIAARRAVLEAEIVRETVPLLLAQAAYGRADGLIRDINAVIRTRFSDTLVELGPSPLNPSLWPEAFGAISHYTTRLVGEVRDTIAQEASRTSLMQKAPLALLFAGLGLWMLIGARRRIADLVKRGFAQGGEPTLWQSSLADLTRLLVPSVGAAAVIFAIRSSELAGIWGTAIIDVLPQIALALIAAPWLGHSVFGTAQKDEGDTVARSGNRMSVLLGIVYAASVLLSALTIQGEFSTGTQAVLNFPLVVIAAFVFYRLSGILKNGWNADLNSNDETETSEFVFSAILSRLLLIFAIVAPIIAAIGYFAAARFLVFPSIVTLGLLATLLVLFGMIRTFLDYWIEGDDHELRRDQTRLIPVFVGFLLSLGALPLLALIWGARPSDLWEIWGWLSDGVSIGESRFSLTDLLVFILVFGIGYTITRLLQKTIRKTVLPRTKMDIGGKSAVLTGVGYAGITIAALAAISATGLDLSSLAIVAGALSVGIGFGLQAIVSNFVSGIILLVERPIKEGDWIIAGGHEGIVRKISVRATLVDTFDRCAVVIPNSDLIAGSVLNWNSPDLSGRVKVPIGVAYGTDPEKVKAVLLSIAAEQPAALKYPAPSVIFKAFGASSLDFEMRVFIRDVGNILSVRSDINFEIARRFAQEGIEIPFDQQDVTLKNVDQIGAAISTAIKGIGSDSV
ncbi:MAG: mechanosensitive ion channel family protein [Rhodobacteraceae bacterium]|nr:mechanosensitive ion channel family protein [Paracoccaceae bacterium]